jgi:two-component system, LytTR family, response regulator
VIRCIIIDDEKDAVDLLKYYVSQVSDLELVGTFNDPLSALQMIRNSNIDLVLLDIKMPKMDGMQFVQAVTKPVKFVFVTAHDSFAMNGFDLGVIDYLLKPVSLHRFMVAIEKVQNVNPVMSKEGGVELSPVDHIFVKTELKGKLKRIDLADIVYIKSIGHFASIQCRNYRVLVLITLKNLNELLPTPQFLRIHKSYIISSNYVSSIESSSVLLKFSEQMIPIGDTYRSAFYEYVKRKILKS